MKNILCIAALFAAQNFAIQSVAADPLTKEVGISVHEAFVPEKIDYGKDAKIVLSGMFPNSCYKWSRVNIQDVSPKIHHVQARAMVTQTMCLMVLVPFSKEVNLGQLETGEHTLRFINGDDTYFERTLVVE